MRIFYDEVTSSALEYQIMNSSILVTFERFVFVFNRLTHMMETHEKCGRNIRIKTYENYNQHEQTALIWMMESDKPLIKYTDGKSPIYNG